jgi:hypothetical protein
MDTNFLRYLKIHFLPKFEIFKFLKNWKLIHQIMSFLFKVFLHEQSEVKGMRKCLKFSPLLIWMGTLKRGETGRVSALPANIRLGCRDLPGTYTQAYYEHAESMDVKSYITLGSGFVILESCVE